MQPRQVVVEERCGPLFWGFLGVLFKYLPTDHMLAKVKNFLPQETPKTRLDLYPAVNVTKALI